MTWMGFDAASLLPCSLRCTYLDKGTSPDTRLKALSAYPSYVHINENKNRGNI